MAQALSCAGSRRLAIVGGGWAGMAAAVRAVQLGHKVSVFEAGRQLGGRARGLPLTLPDGRTLRIDNGQHILIGAYTQTLALLRTIGVAPERVLLRQPLDLRFADDKGLALPDWPQPFNLLWGLARARGWRWPERVALLRRVRSWQRSGFACPPHTTVAGLTARLPQRLLDELMEPLCVSALNTPLHEASGQVFLRVLQDALFGTAGGSDLLLPRTDLGQLLPEAAADWIRTQGGRVLLGQRVAQLTPASCPDRGTPIWQLAGESFDHVLWATAAPHAARAMRHSAAHASPALAQQLTRWAAQASGIEHRPITSVYAQITPVPKANAQLPRPMVALRSNARTPAQFVFQRDALCDTPQPTGLLCFVASHSQTERQTLEASVVAQAQEQLGLRVQPLFSLTEKRATFACVTQLKRPGPHIALGLSACGDYVDGPYPATLEGAVRSGWQQAEALGPTAAMRLGP